MGSSPFTRSEMIIANLSTLPSSSLPMSAIKAAASIHHESRCAYLRLFLFEQCWERVLIAFAPDLMRHYTQAVTLGLNDWYNTLTELRL